MLHLYVKVDINCLIYIIMLAKAYFSHKFVLYEPKLSLSNLTNHNDEFNNFFIIFLLVITTTNSVCKKNKQSKLEILYFRWPIKVKLYPSNCF